MCTDVEMRLLAEERQMLCRPSQGAALEPRTRSAALLTQLPTPCPALLHFGAILGQGGWACRTQLIWIAFEACRLVATLSTCATPKTFATSLPNGRTTTETDLEISVGLSVLEHGEPRNDSSRKRTTLAAILCISFLRVGPTLLSTIGLTPE